MAGRKESKGKTAPFAREAIVHLDHLYRVAFHLAKDGSKAEDLVQETFVRALASYEQFTLGTNLKSWLTRILYNCFFDDYHRSKRWTSSDAQTEFESTYERDPPGEEPGPENNLLRHELRNQLTIALMQIPDEFRIPIVLVDIGEFSYEEAAAILSCPIGTIRSRLSRGRRLLRQKLNSYIRENDESQK